MNGFEKPPVPPGAEAQPARTIADWVGMVNKVSNKKFGMEFIKGNPSHGESKMTFDEFQQWHKQLVSALGQLDHPELGAVMAEVKKHQSSLAEEADETELSVSEMEAVDPEETELSQADIEVVNGDNPK